MIGNLVYINTSRMKKDGKKDEKTTEAGTLSPQFGTYQSGDVASNGLNVTVAYSAKYDAQQLAYQSAYVAFGVPLNGYALPASKTAGYVKNSALPTLNGLNMAGDSMGETESSDEIDGVSEADADGAWDDNEAWEEETTEDTAVDNEERLRMPMSRCDSSQSAPQKYVRACTSIIRTTSAAVRSSPMRMARSHNALSTCPRVRRSSSNRTPPVSAPTSSTAARPFGTLSERSGERRSWMRRRTCTITVLATTTHA